MTRSRKAMLVVFAVLTLALSLACGMGSGSQTPTPTPTPTPTTPVAPVAPTTPVAPVAPVAPTAPGGDFLGASMTARAQQFAQGMHPATDLFRGNLATGATQDFQAVLAPGKCYKIIGVGGATVQDLDLFLFDPNGTQVSQDTATDNYPVLGLQEPICPTAPGSYRVQVKMYTGQGEFAMQVFSN